MKHPSLYDRMARCCREAFGNNPIMMRVVDVAAHNEFRALSTVETAMDCTLECVELAEFDRAVWYAEIGLSVIYEHGLEATEATAWLLNIVGKYRKEETPMEL